jgi:hypothetical protein
MTRHDVTSQKTDIFIVTTMRTSDLMYEIMISLL